MSETFTVEKGEVIVALQALLNKKIGEKMDKEVRGMVRERLEN